MLWSSKPEISVRIRIPAHIVGWCNGSTIDFDSISFGSSPGPITYRVVEESGLSRFVWDEEHAGSNPAYPTHWNITQLVRVSS